MDGEVVRTSEFIDRMGENDLEEHAVKIGVDGVFKGEEKPECCVCFGTVERVDRESKTFAPYLINKK
eukprot:676025-Rhodomonas_salina.1